MATALITGASSGIGEEFARQLAERGHDLVLVARNETKLRQVAAALDWVNVEVLPADLSKAADTDRVAARLSQSERPISLLVNNAGFGLGQVFVEGDTQRELDALNVMVRAVMVLSQAAARAMKARHHGAIVNISSVASRTAGGTYAAHKTWVNVFSEALASELKGSGVTVTSVRPGTTATEFFDKIGFDFASLPTIARISPQQVVAEAMRGVSAGKVEVVPSFTYKVVDALTHISPRPLIRLITGRSSWRIR